VYILEGHFAQAAKTMVAGKSAGANPSRVESVIERENDDAAQLVLGIDGTKQTARA
jgi:hypothetical protein